jgi:hemerythrin-like domain-containing protein
MVPAPEITGMDRTNLFNRMRADHGRVLVDLERLEMAAGCAPAHALDLAALRELATAMERNFALHMSAEDDVLFPALARALPATAASLAPLRDEHRELRAMLADLAGLLDRPASSARDEQIAVLARDFADLLRIHIRKEEAIAFRIAEPVLHGGELDQLAARWNPPSITPARCACTPPGKEPCS